MTDLTDYKTASRLSPHINAGASARLNLQPMASDLSGEAHAAFCHGWRTTDEAENRAGRPMPCGEAAGWHASDKQRRRAEAIRDSATSMVGGA
jgi:hypothetical protein